MFSKILLSLLLVTIASGQEVCTPTTPISTGLLGKIFSVSDSCYRPNSSNMVVAWKQVLVLEIGKGAPLTCPRKFVYYYRSPDQVPYVEEFPSMSYGGDFDTIRRDGDAQLFKWCTANQGLQKKTYWAKWGSRTQFIATAKFMLAEMVRIRDYTCDINEPIAESQKRTIANSPIQGLISYFYTVAYQHGFCIE